jgi:hypothetical protein
MSQTSSPPSVTSPLPNSEFRSRSVSEGEIPNSYSVAQWLYRALGQTHWSVKTQQRGNILHVLFEAGECPTAADILQPLVETLVKGDIQAFLPADQPPVYLVMLYGRQQGERQPRWKTPVHLNQLSRYLELLRQPAPVVGEEESDTALVLATDAPKPPQYIGKTLALSADDTIRPGAALMLSNRSLASQGNPETIAHYLSETLSALGIAVEVSAKAVKPENLGRNQRLQIACESPYSLDPAVVAEPIAQRLRDLHLEGFHEAAVVSRVRGEAELDWVLRVDLTPPEDMLRRLARWGDLLALVRLLHSVLATYGITVESDLKDKTVHLFCKLPADNQDLAKEPIIRAIAPFLQSLAPQGIHSAMIYGVKVDSEWGGGTIALESPSWVDWFGLPAAHHPDLTPTAQELAEEGDLEAVKFLLDRLLNPDLDVQLATGGVQIYLRRKIDLLHVMCDAPICPRQTIVAQTVAKFVKELRLPHVAGVRVYGRRAGQKRPLWHYELDFVPRQRLVSEATPEFAASADHVGDLLTASGPDLRVETPESEDDITFSSALSQLLQGSRSVLIRSQLFLPVDAPLGSPETSPLVDMRLPRWARPLSQRATIALIWGMLGLMFTFETDWFLARLVQQLSTKPVASSVSPMTAAAKQEAALPTVETDPIAQIHLNSTHTPEGTNTFDHQTFTQSSGPALPFESPVQASAIPDLKPDPNLAPVTDYPSLNNPLLDQKLALYQQYLLTGEPPDVLIVGSSRALRGVDPQVLADHLASLGYSNLRIFNFAINGSTAQVVDLQLRQLLKPEELPRLVIWADGARAFNSGHVDVTYNAIAVSEGFKQVEAGNFPALVTKVQKEASGPNSKTDPSEAAAESTGGFSYGDATRTAQLEVSGPEKISIDFNEWLTDEVGQLSLVYPDRDRLKTLVNRALATLLLTTPEPEPPSNIQDQSSGSHFNPADPEFSRIPDAPEGEGELEFNGFLSLSLRFNPATYYQKYARVQGQFDGDYKDFHLEGDQSEAFDRILNYLGELKIPVVFVNLPLTSDYLDSDRFAYEEIFQARMYQLMTDQWLVFRDLSQVWPDEFGNFSDPSHLNRYGAEEVSIYLAEDPLIPWPIVTDDSNKPL